MLKQKRKEKAGKWSRWLRCLKWLDREIKRKCWKRRINKICFWGKIHKETSKTRNIHPADGSNVQRCKCYSPWTQNYIQTVDSDSQKESPSNTYTSLGDATKDNYLIVLVTQKGNVVWSKYAQVTNNLELNGCNSSILLVWMIHCIYHALSHLYTNQSSLLKRDELTSSGFWKGNFDFLVFGE